MQGMKIEPSNRNIPSTIRRCATKRNEASVLLTIWKFTCKNKHIISQEPPYVPRALKRGALYEYKSMTKLAA
jgi:hypothetical protein